MDLPRHIAIIPDGNRRFAKEKGMPEWKGHEEGIKKFKEILEWWVELDIPELSLWGMSTENLNRSKGEVGHLFRLFREMVNGWKNEIKKPNNFVEKYQIKIRFFGYLEKLPSDIVEEMRKVEKHTEKNSKRFLNILLAYGGRYEITSAINKLLSDGKKNVTEKNIQDNLMINSDVDLVIRPGGMSRLSGLMPWQTVYSELYFTKTYFPALTKKEFLKAIKWFVDVKRNFGK